MLPWAKMDSSSRTRPYFQRCCLLLASRLFWRPLQAAREGRDRALPAPLAIWRYLALFSAGFGALEPWEVGSSDKRQSALSTQSGQCAYASSKLNPTRRCGGRTNVAGVLQIAINGGRRAQRTEPEFGARWGRQHLSSHLESTVCGIHPSDPSFHIWSRGPTSVTRGTSRLLSGAPLVRRSGRSGSENNHGH